jgi:hypothetical protein
MHGASMAKKALTFPVSTTMGEQKPSLVARQDSLEAVTTVEDA